MAKEGEVIERPENWDDMVKKHEEREEEQLKRVMEKRKAESKEELKDIAAKAITTRQQRIGGQKPLKDRTVLRDPSSPEVKAARKKVEEETAAVALKLLQGTLPSD